jgi:heme A synthase
VSPGFNGVSSAATVSTCRSRDPQGIVPAMEFLNFLLILWAGWLIWRRPEKERLAFRLLVVSCLLMAALFLIGTHTSLVPGVNL